MQSLLHNGWTQVDTREDGIPILVCYKEASEHLVLEVKKNLTRKACCVKDGQKSDDPESLNFAGVFSRKNIRIVFDCGACLIEEF